MTDKKLYLTRAQLISELGRCLGCKSKPCMNACPVNCNPQEFIAKAKANDFAGAVETITRNNPMGQTCGLICPDKFCMQACTRAGIDFPINIPRVQATILEKYRTAESAAHPKLPANGKKVAVIGAGPAGIAATAELSRLGYRITLFEGFEKIGGALNLIPDKRLPFEVIAKDWSFIDDPDMIELRLNTPVNDPAALLEQDFDGVIVATGEPEGINLGIDGEEHAVSYLDYLRHPEHYAARDNIAVIGGGAVATDCALTAVNNGAENVEMFVRRRVSDMRVTGEERKSLLDAGVDLTTMTKIKKIGADGDYLTLYTAKNRFNRGKLEEIPDTTIARPGFSLVIKAIGSTAPRQPDTDRVIYAGDCKHGGSTIVEALASGKAAAYSLDEKLIP